MDREQMVLRKSLSRQASLLGLAALLALSAAAQAATYRVSAFSFVARDPQTGQFLYSYSSD